MNGIKERVFTAFLGAPIFLLFLFWGSLPFAILCIVVTTFCMSEIVNVLKDKISSIEISVAFLAAPLYPVVALSAGLNSLLILLTANIILSLLLLVLIKKEITPARLFFILSPVYVGFFLSHLILLRGMGAPIVLTLIITTWAYDIFAFLVGSSIGRIKLVPTISPNKTLEGMVGGLLAAILIVLAMNSFDLSNFQLIIVGTLIAFSAQIGDLFESKLKRIAKIKDSGALLPGHGGFLDRFDSLLFTAPSLFYLLTLTGWLS